MLRQALVVTADANFIIATNIVLSGFQWASVMHCVKSTLALSLICTWFVSKNDLEVGLISQVRIIIPKQTPSGQDVVYGGDSWEFPISCVYKRVEERGAEMSMVFC